MSDGLATFLNSLPGLGHRSACSYCALSGPYSIQLHLVWRAVILELIKARAFGLFDLTTVICFLQQWMSLYHLFSIQGSTNKIQSQNFCPPTWEDKMSKRRTRRTNHPKGGRPPKRRTLVIHAPNMLRMCWMMNLKTCAEPLLLDWGQGLQDGEADVILPDVAAWLPEVVWRSRSEPHIRTSGHGESENPVDLRRFIEQTLKEVSQQPLWSETQQNIDNYPNSKNCATQYELYF